MSHRMIPVAIEAVSGAMAAPTGGDLGGSGFAGTGTEAAADALTGRSLCENVGEKVGEKVGDLRERGGRNVWGLREMERCRPLDLMDGGDCLGRGRRRREVVRGSVAIKTTAFWREWCVWGNEGGGERVRERNERG